MKILFIMLSYVLTFHAFAEDKSSGCGMGWAVTKKNGLLSSTTRSYTNSTFSSTFGMTSGTSGCAKHSIAQNDKIDLYYAEGNYNELMVEMAVGEGQYLEAFAYALGCEESTHGEFYKTVQENYQNIYETHSVEPVKMLNNTKKVMKANKVLSKSCSKVLI